MPVLIERPKMSRAMWEALKSHIIKERQKKKQEEEADAAIERLKRERENKQKQDILTLDQTKEQLAQLEAKMEMLKQEKHELFCQLKKVLHEDETRRRAVVKETSEIMNLGGHNYPPALHVGGAHAHMFMQVAGQMASRSNVYKTNSIPQQSMLTTSVKRQRSPSPTNFRQRYPYSKPLNMAYTQALSSAEPGPSYSTSQTNSAGVTYSSSHAYPQGQSAFANFPAHYTQQQKQIAEHLQSQPYAVQHVQQQEYMRSLHQSLEHSHKSTSFADQEKFFQVSGISTGYPVATHQSQHTPAVSSTYQAAASAQQHVSYSNQQTVPRHSYPGQPNQRFY